MSILVKSINLKQGLLWDQPQGNSNLRGNPSRLLWSLGMYIIRPCDRSTSRLLLLGHPTNVINVNESRAETYFQIHVVLSLCLRILHFRGSFLPTPALMRCVVVAPPFPVSHINTAASLPYRSAPFGLFPY